MRPIAQASRKDILSVNDAEAAGHDEDEVSARASVYVPSRGHWSMSSQGAPESSPAASVIKRRGMPPFAPPRRPGHAIVDDVDEEADEIDPDFDPDDDVTMRDPEPTSRKRKAPPAPRPKRRRKTKAAPVEPVLSEYELGRRAKIKRNNKFLVSVGLLFPR